MTKPLVQSYNSINVLGPTFKPFRTRSYASVLRSMQFNVNPFIARVSAMRHNYTCTTQPCTDNCTGKKGFRGSPSNTALQAIIWDENRKSGKKIPPCSGTRLRIESEALRPFLYCFVSYDFCEPTHKQQQQQSNHLRETCRKQSSTYGKISKGEKPKSSDWCLIKLKPLI
jgi:hypothetical protein